MARTTVKSHLKQLYAKAGTSQQAQLLLVLSKLQQDQSVEDGPHARYPNFDLNPC
jgi:hypothetical protein